MNSTSGASTFAKGLEVLACFESGRADLTMADVARLSGFDRATARRLCLTLEQSGYLSRQGRHLRLAPKVVALTGGYLSSHAIGKSVQPILNQFAEELEGEIALAVRDGTRAIYIARSAVASARLSFGFSVGSVLPLLPTAAGRMLLAGCNASLRGDVMQACPLERYTGLTDTDLGSLRAKIDAAAREGYAHAVGEFEVGVAGLAVPIANIGEAQAVLASSAPVSARNQSAVFEQTLDVLRRAAMSLRG